MTTNHLCNFFEQMLVKIPQLLPKTSIFLEYVIASLVKTPAFVMCKMITF
ncbi:hypothetical protein RchiOBHm_Chr6g0245071 [Rosa chinensis]|uniref:Uncharacterized protein n=1 Tax=Rosa chinensis TaxID=74649 RepID=A0A2P6PJ67_ROSCH|nr:hypothetical protein RchiOBHm_Chr6g0245071 [Rosa chinensis]